MMGTGAPATITEILSHAIKPRTQPRVGDLVTQTWRYFDDDAPGWVAETKVSPTDLVHYRCDYEDGIERDELPQVGDPMVLTANAASQNPEAWWDWEVSAEVVEVGLSPGLWWLHIVRLRVVDVGR